jgi:RNA polymerase sigma-70 factor, ECF subfamily
MDESALVKEAKSGSLQAFTMLADRWQSRIERFAYGYLGDYDDAAEIAQKTMIRVYAGLGSLQEAGKFSSWIYRIANNLCLDEMKRAGRRKAEPLDTVLSQSQENGTLSPDLISEQKELGELIHKALLTLPEEQRTVIILKEFEGLKFREIAEVLDQPESTVKSRMYYGLKSLRNVLTNWNIPKEYLNYG